MSAPDTLTLADLRTRAFPQPQLGVLGDPIAHSLSPAMHNAALAALRPAHPALAHLAYLRLHILAEELPEAYAELLATIARSLATRLSSGRLARVSSV